MRKSVMKIYLLKDAKQRYSGLSGSVQSRGLATAVPHGLGQTPAVHPRRVSLDVLDVVY